MISQTSSSPTARRNPYTCQENLDPALSFSPLSLSSNFPLQISVCPCIWEGWDAPLPEPALEDTPPQQHSLTSVSLSLSQPDLPKLCTHPVVNVVCAPKQVENEPQDQKTEAGKQSVIKLKKSFFKLCARTGNTCMDRTCVGRPWAHTTPEMKSHL